MIGRALACLALSALPLSGQALPTALTLGLRGGVEFHRGGRGDDHVGMQAWIPLSRHVVIVPALDRILGFPDDPISAWSGSAWRAYVSVRARPIDAWWLPEVGYGASLSYARATHAPSGSTRSSFDVTDAAVLAFPGPDWRVHPYAELVLVDLLRRPGKAGGHLFIGLRASVR